MVCLEQNVDHGGINMAIKTQQHFRGFLVPAPFNSESIDLSLTTATQSGERCGNPKNLTPNDLCLTAFGDQNDFADITVESVRSGTPGDVQNPAMFKFYETNQSIEYGQFGRNVISGFEMINPENSKDFKQPNFLPLKNGDKLVAYQRRTKSNVPTITNHYR